MKNKKTVYCIMGRTAVGKDTLVGKFLDLHKDMSQVISYSTRPKRAGEGNTHIFIEKDDVQKYKDDIVAYTKIGEFEYFATREQLEKCDLYIIDPIGYGVLNSKYCNEFKFVPILCWVDKEEERRRSVIRGDDPDVFKKRVESEDIQFSNFENGSIKHFKINMNNLNEAINKLEQIILDSDKNIKE